MQRLHINRGFRIGFWCLPKHSGRTLKQLVTPRLDLVGVNIDILRQFGQGLLSLDRYNGHLCLKCRAMVPARAFCLGLLVAYGIMPLLRRKST